MLRIKEEFLKDMFDEELKEEIKYYEEECNNDDIWKDRLEELKTNGISYIEKELSSDDTTKDVYAIIDEDGCIGMSDDYWVNYNTIFDKIYDLILDGKVEKVDTKSGHKF